MKKNTYIDERRELIHQLQRVVCFLLRLSAEQYSQLQYQAGIDYLRTKGYDASMCAVIESSRIFWNWWRNEWATRDQAFVNSVEKGDTLAMLKEQYLYNNSPRTLAASVHPNATVLNESYSVMIGQLIKKEVAV